MKLLFATVSLVLLLAAPAWADSEITDSYFKVQTEDNLGYQGWGYLGAAIRVAHDKCDVRVEDFIALIPNAIREEVISYVDVVNTFGYRNDTKRTCRFIAKQMKVIQDGRQ